MTETVKVKHSHSAQTTAQHHHNNCQVFKGVLPLNSEKILPTPILFQDLRLNNAYVFCVCVCVCVCVCLS